MSKIYLFSIGGSGARVMRSFSMLMAAGLPNMDSVEIVPIIIDYDVANADKQLATECLETCEKINNASSSSGFFKTKIRKLRDVGAVPAGLNFQTNNYDIFFSPTNVSKTFATHIGLPTLIGEFDLTASLVNALYDNSNAASPTTELNLDMTVGFKGNPNIGSVVFSELGKTPEFIHFATQFDPLADRIFIVSSIFGGTGSSGFPELVNLIRTHANPGLANATIGAMVLLPYYKVTDDPNSAIDSDFFNSKTKAALSYYETSGLNNKINSIYYIGDNSPVTYVNEEGGDTQRNDSNITELISAMSIVHYINNCPPIGANWAYEFGVNNINSNIKNISLFKADTIKNYINYLTMLGYGVKYYQDAIEGKRSKVNTSKAFYAGLTQQHLLNSQPIQEWQKFCQQFNKWLEELQQRNFAPYNLSHDDSFNKFLLHKPLCDGGFLKSKVISDNDFESALNVSYNNHSTTINKFELFLTILRDATEVILKMANNASISQN